MNGRARVIITGTVQGVFFRASTETEALKHGLTGWVRNLPPEASTKNKVEALFEGSSEEIKKLIEWCHRGPERAKVTNLTVQWEEHKNEFTTFSTKY